MDKWNVLSLFILSIGLFEISGKQLFNMENSLESSVNLVTIQYNFWLTVNLASIALGLSMLHKLRTLSVTASLSLSQRKEGKEEKMKLERFLRRLWKNVRAGAGPATIAALAVGVLIAAYILPIGLLAIADANVTGWTAVTVTIFQTVFPILVILGLALKYVPR